MFDQNQLESKLSCFEERNTPPAPLLCPVGGMLKYGVVSKTLQTLFLVQRGSKVRAGECTFFLKSLIFFLDVGADNKKFENFQKFRAVLLV